MSWINTKLLSRVRLVFPLTALLLGCGSSSTKPAVTADAGKDAYVVDDAGVCIVSLAEISPTLCAATAAEQGANLTCVDGPVAKISQNSCEQRQQFVWNFGIYSKACYYDQGVLVGARLGNDTPTFCYKSAYDIQFGTVDPCPTTTWQLVVDCRNPSDAGN